MTAARDAGASVPNSPGIDPTKPNLPDGNLITCNPILPNMLKPFAVFYEFVLVCLDCFRNLFIAVLVIVFRLQRAINPVRETAQRVTQCGFILLRHFPVIAVRVNRASVNLHHAAMAVIATMQTDRSARRRSYLTCNASSSAAIACKPSSVGAYALTRSSADPVSNETKFPSKLAPSPCDQNPDQLIAGTCRTLPLTVLTSRCLISIPRSPAIRSASSMTNSENELSPASASRYQSRALTFAASLNSPY